MKHKRMLQHMIDRSIHRDAINNQGDEKSSGSMTESDQHKVDLFVRPKIQKALQG
jgi:hypothetical protein